MIKGYDDHFGFNRLYIVELQRAHLLSLAQVLHLGLALDPDNKTTIKTLDQLALQSDGVYREPQKHRVYDETNAPPNARIVKEGVYYIPYKNTSV